MDRTEKIKDYLKRLGEGEDLESVRKDFVKEFSHVEAMEIMQAEETLLKEGTDPDEIKKLCDIHSALFHGKTDEEKKLNAEIEVARSIQRSKEFQADSDDRKEKAKNLSSIGGHPLNILTKENRVLEEALKEAKEILKEDEDLKQAIQKIEPVIKHYAKKGDLIYPHLKVAYGVTGPSNVMWSVDDEIRDEIKALLNAKDQDEEWRKRAEAVINRTEEMIFKEENILFPAAALTFTNRDWRQIYGDLKDYQNAFDVENEIWEEAENKVEKSQESDEILLPGGSVALNELKAILKTLPIEITFIDKNDINKYFNEGPKAFKRPSIALGHDVYSCHPPKVEKAVRKILDDFKSGKRDKFEMFSQKGGKPFKVTYLAVRDENNDYLGTVELVEEIEDIIDHYKNK